jgi:hypothetical protein
MMSYFTAAYINIIYLKLKHKMLIKLTLKAKQHAQSLKKLVKYHTPTLYQLGLLVTCIFLKITPTTAGNRLEAHSLLYPSEIFGPRSAKAEHILQLCTLLFLNIMG